MIFKPLQLIYDFVTQVKNKLYDYGIIKKVFLDMPVISVGNLSVGGTGKTPCVYLVATELFNKKLFKKIVIVSRSYKGTLKTAVPINLSLDKATTVYGDEPCMLQSKLPFCTVWAGPTKFKTAMAAAAADKPDLMLIDDGFSHRKLNRHFDLVLIDTTAPLRDLQTLPVGRLRESLNSLSRASAILLTKTNLVDVERVNQITELILNNSSGLKESIFHAQAKLIFAGINPHTDALFVFCGLGNPKSFEQALKQAGFQIDDFKTFADHHQYSNSDLDTLWSDFERKREKNPKLKLVTTSKDLIKIRSHKITKEIFEIDYLIEMESLEKVELFEKICRNL